MSSMTEEDRLKKEKQEKGGREERQGEGLDMGNTLWLLIKWWKQERKHVLSDRTGLWWALMHSLVWAWDGDRDREEERGRHHKDFGQIHHPHGLIQCVAWQQLSFISLLLALPTNTAAVSKETVPVLIGWNFLFTFQIPIRCHSLSEHSYILCAP